MNATPGKPPLLAASPPLDECMSFQLAWLGCCTGGSSALFPCSETSAGEAPVKGSLWFPKLAYIPNARRQLSRASFSPPGTADSTGHPRAQPQPKGGQDRATAPWNFLLFAPRPLWTFQHEKGAFHARWSLSTPAMQAVSSRSL